MTTLHDELLTMGDSAVEAARQLIKLSAEHKNRILAAMARELENRQDSILAANAADLEAGRAAGLNAALLDRLQLTPARIKAMADGLRTITQLPDPVGRTLRRWTRPNGLKIRKISVPLGVIAIIFESRPNVTADATALCLKSSNAVILRGGKEALRSNLAIAEALQAGGASEGLPPHSVQMVRTADRDAVRELVQMEGRIDLVMPRGGEGLIRAVVEQARVPVIKHYKGVCHVYVDKTADPQMALSIVENAKCQRPGVCNAMETLLVHQAVAVTILPTICTRLSACGVELRGDEIARSVVPGMKPAEETDWPAEYQDLILAVKVVPSLDSAIEHINRYGSRHSDAIITKSAAAWRRFARDVDSAAIYWNASTRFTDGGEFGFGAEIGISTDKLHARGPMGLEELTTYKYVVTGSGQVRS
jgi:glutamate-5-semialdehyde dehydrogenase